MYITGILTVSDRGSAGEYEDRSGPLIRELLTTQTGYEARFQEIVPDVESTISQTLIAWSEQGANLILTTGGTGFAQRDVTPEATRSVIDREAPGVAEALRAESLKVTRHAMLSRGIAGMRGQTLIINLPGSPKAVKENLAVLFPVLPHALDLLLGHSGNEQQHRKV